MLAGAPRFRLCVVQQHLDMRGLRREVSPWQGPSQQEVSVPAAAWQVKAL
jgi:hypothetical protein